MERGSNLSLVSKRPVISWDTSRIRDEEVQLWNWHGSCRLDGRSLVSWTYTRHPGVVYASTVLKLLIEGDTLSLKGHRGGIPELYCPFLDSSALDMTQTPSRSIWAAHFCLHNRMVEDIPVKKMSTTNSGVH